MNGVLLDTHVFIWAMLSPDRLSALSLQTIEATPDVHLSVVSFYEIEAKRRRNRLRGLIDETARLPTDLLPAAKGLGFRILDLDAEQAIAAGRLDIAHADPWDRILVAQARDLGLILVSADAHLLAQAGDTPVVW